MSYDTILQNPPASELPVPVQPSRTPGILLYVLGLLLVSLLSGTTVYYWTISRFSVQDNLLKKDSLPPASLPTTIPSIATPSNTVKWTTYQNKLLSFEISCPDNLPPLTEAVYKGETGTKLLIGSEDDGGFLIAANSIDYSAGRSGWITDFVGYQNTNGAITYGLTGETRFSLPPEVVKRIYTNKNGIEIVLITGKDGTGEMFGPMPGTAGEGRLSALVNTKDKKYPGIVLISPVNYSDSQFLQIIDTLKFN